MTGYPWSAHDILTAADLNAAFASAVVSTGLGAWTPYTPAWSGTLGNGTLTGKYMKTGRKVDFYISLTWGTTTSHPAAAQTLGLPPFASATIGWVGGGRIVDTSAGAQYYRHMFTNSGTVVAFASEAGGFVTNALPMVWASTDTFQVQGTYESTT